MTASLEESSGRQRRGRRIAMSRLFGDKYFGGAFATDGRHAWLRIVPEKIVSWDFRKAG